jgi:hypothetical protein
MIPKRSQSGERRLAPHEPGLSRPQPRKEMEETFVKLYDLLEQYSPPWYPNQLHEKAESVLRQIGH